MKLCKDMSQHVKPSFTKLFLLVGRAALCSPPNTRILPHVAYPKDAK